MKDRILLIAAIAFVAYVLVPELARALADWRRARTLRVLKANRGIPAVCTGYADRMLVMETAKGQEIELKPRKTRFFFQKNDGSIEAVRWQDMLMIDRRKDASVILPEKWRTKTWCIFRCQGQKIEDCDALSVSFPADVRIKHYSVALGACIEFLIFLESIEVGIPYWNFLPLTELAGDGRSLVSLFALVAVFGKALPYLPPGLFFTLIAHGPTRAGKRRKKSRWLRAGGFILVAIGVALNIAVILFVIRKIGFNLPVV